MDFKPLHNELSMVNSQALGAKGERHAAWLFERVGYHVEIVAHVGGIGDLRVLNPETGQSWRIEVKTAKRSHNGCKWVGWQFCLNKKGHADVGCSDFVLLMAVRAAGDAVCFLMPVREIGCIQKIGIKTKSPLDYRGKWAKYRMPYDGINLGEHQQMLHSQQTVV